MLLRSSAGRTMRTLTALVIVAAGLGACSDGVEPKSEGIVLVVSAGNGQAGTPMTTLAESLSVRAIRVTEDGEEPVAGLALVWRPLSGDLARVTPEHGVTDADGYLRAQWKLGTGSGTHRADVHVGNGGDRARFEATAAAGFRPVSVSSRGGCGLDEAGAIWCVEGGALVRIDSDQSFTQLSDGATRGDGCALTAAGAAWCWEPVLRPPPFPVLPGTAFTAISNSYQAGRYRACGVTTDGDGYCWRIRDGYPAEPIPRDLALTEVSLGHDRACVIDSASGAWCWDAPLGDEPGLILPAEETLVSGVSRISVGDNGRTCGLVAGQAACWGADHLGDPAVDPPGPAFPRGDGQPFVEIGATNNVRFLGASYGLTASGRLYVWGGIGWPGLLPVSDPQVPVPLLGAGPWTSPQFQGSGMCALLAVDRTLYCWQLTPDGYEPRPVPAPPGTHSLSKGELE